MIYARSLTEKLYADIDLLISCSDFEGGPLGIFEAAACGVPVLLRDGLGNASEIKGIATFNTTSEAVQVIQTWNADSAALATYTQEICQQVRTHWGMKQLIERHLVPLLSSKPYDFVEIGTSDFETLVETTGDRETGICVEPVQYYLNRLVKRPKVQYLCGAISDKDIEKVAVYYIADETIKALKLPEWVRGCNTVGSPHPTVARLLQNDTNVWSIDYIPQYSFCTFVKRFNIGQIVHLKLDTDGHDCTILRNVAKAIQEHNFRRPLKITFKTNSLSSVLEQSNTIHLFRTLGYKVTEKYGDNTILEII